MSSFIARLIRGAAALALLVCASCLRGAPPEGNFAGDDRPWLELVSPHFVLRTDLDEPGARDALLDLERVRLALLTGAWHSKTQPPGRAQVILLASERELDEFVRRGVVGFAASDPFEAPLIVASAASRFDQSAVLKHELAHLFDNQYLLRQPRWLSEGLAIYLETMQVSRAGRSVTVGDVAAARLDWLRRRANIDVKRLLHQGPEILQAPAAEVESFYAQSWLLTHYLINQRRAQFDAWLDRLAQAEDPDAAWLLVFGALDAKQLGFELHDYLLHGDFKTWTFALPAQETPIESRELSRADALAERAILRSISLGKRSAATDAQAALEAAEAHAADPGNLLALRIWLTTGTRKLDEASGAAKQVARAHPDDARAHETLGIVLSLQRPQGLPQAKLELQRALQINAEDSRAMGHLAEVELLLGEKEEALAAARGAVALDPANANSLHALASAWLANGNCTSALAAEKRALDLIHDGNSAAVAFLEERVRTLDGLCKAGPVTEAKSAPAR